MLRRVQERTTIDCPTSGLKPHRQITRELCMQRIKIHHQSMRSLSELIGGLGNISITWYAVIEVRENAPVDGYDPPTRSEF